MIQAVVRLNGRGGEGEETVVEVALPCVPQNGEYIHYDGKAYVVTHVKYVLSKMAQVGGRQYASHTSVVVTAYIRP